MPLHRWIAHFIAPLCASQELFTELLISPVADLSARLAKKYDQCDITVGDIIGPLKEEAGKEEAGIGARESNFSLLS